jgi:hypothetical protein
VTAARTYASSAVDGKPSAASVEATPLALASSPAGDAVSGPPGGAARARLSGGDTEGGGTEGGGTEGGVTEAVATPTAGTGTYAGGAAEVDPVE